MKDPAFLFYASDFLTGVSGLTMEERGQYITLLCLQHQTGHLSEKEIRLCVGNAAADVMAKFEKDENGNFREITEIRIETRNEIEDLKETVEKTKIEIKVLLPRIFRDAVTMEQVYNGMVVFTVPESVAREFSLMQ